MKILLIFFVICCSSVSAQNLKVEMKDKIESLPYGYIYVNGKIKAVSDSTGVALLKADELTIGDTISASYVGYKPKWQIFNSKMAKIGVCELMLETKISNLDAVVVIGLANAEKLFAKRVKSAYAMRNGVLTADFEAQIEPTGEQNNHFVGNFVARNEIDSKKGVVNHFFHHPIKFTTNSDTTSQSLILTYLTKMALNASLQIDVFSNFYYRKTWYNNLRYRYIGKSDGKLLFSVIDMGLSKFIKELLELPIKRNTHFPQLLYVDEKSGEIVKYEMNFITDVEGEVGSLNVKVEYAHSKIKSVNTFIPSQIDLTASTTKFANRNISIKNINFQPE